MANIKSAIKRIRTAERNRLRNRTARTSLRTQIKKLRAAFESGDATAAGQVLRDTHAAIDRTARKGIIHARTASRYKSRLALAHGRLQRGPSAQ